MKFIQEMHNNLLYLTDSKTKNQYYKNYIFFVTQCVFLHRNIQYVKKIISLLLLYMILFDVVIQNQCHMECFQLIVVCQFLTYNINIS